MKRVFHPDYIPAGPRFPKGSSLPRLLSFYTLALQTSKLRLVCANLWLVLPNCWCPTSAGLSATTLKLELSPHIPTLPPPEGPCLLSDQKLFLSHLRVYLQCAHLASFPPISEVKISLCLSHLSLLVGPLSPL